ncbi:hypothetical protein Tco_0626020 [Tanacetum coccineum]|uniref:NAC domain-containing protein n=1 Tax=Tanacetum coccineum TaxID=301880 RepID=A0ABQ4WIK8_9ASTR
MGNTPVYDQGPCYNQDFDFDQPPYYSLSQPQQFDCLEICRGPHYSSDFQTRNQLVYEPTLGCNYDFPCFDQPSQFTPPQPLPLSELNRTELVRQIINTQEQFKINQEQFNMDVQNEINCLQEMLNLRDSNQDPPVDLYDLKGSDKGDNEIDSLTKEPFDTLLMGDEVIRTTPERENDEFIKSSVDDLVLIPRESEVTSVCDDLECDIPVNTPLPTTDVREENFDINSPLGEYVVDFLMENMDVADLPKHLVKQLFSHLVKNSSLTKRMSVEPLGDDSKPISYDVTFSNSLFDLNDDYTLCYDNPVFDDEFEDISSLDLPKLTPVIHESTLLVTLPLPCTDVLGDTIVDIDLLLGEHLDTLSMRDRETDFNPSRDIEELERLLVDDLVPVLKVFDEPIGNYDSMSKSSETSDLFEELIAEFGLDDSIPTKINDKYHDSESDILYFEQLLNEDTSSDVSPALLPTESSSLDLPLPYPKQICLREV